MKIFPQIYNWGRRFKWFLLILIFIILIGSYFTYQTLNKNKNKVQYATATAAKGTLITTVSGSGQVLASNQTDIKAKVSGEVIGVYVKTGDEVGAKDLIIKLDNSDAQTALRNAKNALETAQLELEQLLQPPDKLTLLQAENALAQAQQNKQKAEDNLRKSYDDGYNKLTNVFLNLPVLMSDFQNILFGNDLNPHQWNLDYYTTNNNGGYYREKAYNDYQTANKTYQESYQSYKSISRYSEPTIIENLINQTISTVKAIAAALTSANNLIQYYKDILTNLNLTPASLSITHLSKLNTYITNINSYLSDLLTAAQNIKDNKNALTNAETSVTEKELSLEKLKAGPDELEIRAKKLTIQQKEDMLLNAQQNVDNLYIRVPFKGVIAAINVKIGDSVTSGTTLATLISQQKIAEISLNEVDIAKVKIGQKANITFDALEDVNLTGEVLEVDTLGTVNQGVVTYNVKISFDTQDERIKSGMSLTANIITNAKSDVLLVPNSAVKQDGDSNYVELLEANNKSNTALKSISASNIKKQSVQIGLVNDTMTEIVSGLKEGDMVVTQTITSNSKNQNSQSTGFGLPGLGGSTPRLRQMTR